MELIHNIFSIFSSVIEILIPIVAGLYFLPNSPIHRIVETWIEKRVSHRFNVEFESYRHKLELEADEVRTEHQRLLHNAVLIVEKKHEISRELFRLIHIANGHIGNLYGHGSFPTFTDYSRDNLIKYMDNLNVPGKTMKSILDSWDSNREWATKELRNISRRSQVMKAREVYGEAWNFFLLNSLYLDDKISDTINLIFLPLRQILDHAEFDYVDPEFSFTMLTKDAAKKIEELRNTFRAELLITESSILQNTTKPK